MSSNLKLYMANERKQLVAEINPAGIDAIAKVIKQSKISTIDVQDSTLYGIKTTKDKRFIIIRSNLTCILGQGINLSCNLSKGNLKLLDKIKGNHNVLIFDNPPSTYLFTNSSYTTLIRKVNPQKFDDLLPVSQKKIIRQTYKCKQIIDAKQKSKFVDIFIYDNQIAMVYLPATMTFISFSPRATEKYIERKPQYKLRSYFLFHLSKDEAVLEIIFDKKVFWLRTEIQFTQDITIEQFEPLQQIK